jgi:hypothetical protein
MAKKKRKKTGKRDNGSGANLGFEEKLWAAADKMRGHMDAEESKHVALGLRRRSQIVTGCWEHPEWRRTPIW